MKSAAAKIPENKYSWNFIHYLLKILASILCPPFWILGYGHQVFNCAKHRSFWHLHLLSKFHTDLGMSFGHLFFFILSVNFVSHWVPAAAGWNLGSMPMPIPIPYYLFKSRFRFRHQHPMPMPTLPSIDHIQCRLWFQF